MEQGSQSLAVEEAKRPKIAKVVYRDVTGRKRRMKLRGGAAHVDAVMALVDSLRASGSQDIEAFYQ